MEEREKTFLLQPTNGGTIGESGGDGFSNGPINQQVLPPHDHDYDDHGDNDNHEDDDDDDHGDNDKCSNLPN